MPPETRQSRTVDDVDRELDKLRGFGSALVVALTLAAVVVAAVTAVLWWTVF